MNLTIKRKTKCLYRINDVNIDVRKNVTYGDHTFVKFHGLRQAIFLYLVAGKSRTYQDLLRFDTLTVRYYNNNLAVCDALNFGIAYITPQQKGL